MDENTRDRIASIVAADKADSIPQAPEYVAFLIDRDIGKEHVAASQPAAEVVQLLFRDTC
jgi:hypothetical protein